MFKRNILLLLSLVLSQFLAAQLPQNFYQSTAGKTGRELKTAMHLVIKDHVALEYDEARDHFSETDRRPNGEVWDMYSNVTHYRFPGKSARYGGEGGGYNCEHSFPKSWFGGKVKPMFTDLYHLYPTDGYVNNRRGHFAFGETEGEIYSSSGGWSKVGMCTLPGCSETVFEPNEEYKGDFARTYFYMVTCYEDRLPNWVYVNGKESQGKVPMINQTTYPAFQQWALDMLLRWAATDTVSQKERERNEAVCRIQGNRNPFIDFPRLEQYIWGEKMGTPFDPADYPANGGGGIPQPQPGDTVVDVPVFSLPSGEVKLGSELLITCPTSGAKVVYRVNGGQWQKDYSPARLKVTEDMTVEAYGLYGDRQSATVKAVYTIATAPEKGTGVYFKVTNADELAEGYRYLIVCESEHTAMSVSKGDIRGFAGVEIQDYTLTTEVSASGLPYAFQLEKDEKGWAFYDIADQTYLALTKNDNKLSSVGKSGTEEMYWTISLSSGVATISSVAYSNRSIQYNANSPRFATYRPGQKPVSLYKETVGDGISNTVFGGQLVDVYALNGTLLRRQMKPENAVRGLPRGIYLVGGKKCMIR